MSSQLCHQETAFPRGLFQPSPKPHDRTVGSTKARLGRVREVAPVVSMAHCRTLAQVPRAAGSAAAPCWDACPERALRTMRGWSRACRRRGSPRCSSRPSLHPIDRRCSQSTGKTTESPLPAHRAAPAAAPDRRRIQRSTTSVAPPGTSARAGRHRASAALSISPQSG